MARTDKPQEDKPQDWGAAHKNIDESSSSKLQRLCIFGGALHLFVAIAAGAFGAHGFEVGSDQARFLETGARYQALHGLALLLLPTLPLRTSTASRVAVIFHGGILFFGLSLYAMATGAPRFLGAITPIGGVLFLIGWAMVAHAALRTR